MKTHEILYQTLAQAQDYVNGEQLAQEMGLSRTSIWKAIQRLEKEGIEIESVKNRGYKILSGDLLIFSWGNLHVAPHQAQSPL